MVKLHCGLCGTIFQAKPAEWWICPNCEETGIFNVLSVSEEEIRELCKSLDYVEGITGPEGSIGSIKIKSPIKIGKSDGIYASFSHLKSMEDGLYVLPLLFDKVYIKCMHQLPDEKIGSPLVSNLYSSEIVIPVADEFGLFFLDRAKVKPIWPQDLMSYVPMTNLTTSLSYEDMRAMDDNVLRQLEGKLKQLYGYEWDSPELERNSFYFCLQKELQKYHLDLLIAARMGLPFTIEPLVKEIHYWKMKRVADLYRNEVSREISAVKRFLRSLKISIPTGLTFDDIISFRKQKACADFRAELFSLSKGFQHSCSTDISQDLLARFHHRIMEFNETANSYAETRALIFTGTVSTIGGLLGGPVGAIVGGLGAGLVSPITKATFRKLYDHGHKDWVCFFWKWQKAPTKNHISERLQK